MEKRWEAPWNSPGLNPVDYSIWGALQQLVYRPRRIRDVEHLKEVLQTCWEQIGQDVIDRVALWDSFANDCRSLLQPMEDTLSIALTTVLRATRTLSHLRVLLYKYRTWTTKVNSPVYSAPLCTITIMAYTTKFDFLPAIQKSDEQRQLASVFYQRHNRQSILDE